MISTYASFTHRLIDADLSVTGSLRKLLGEIKKAESVFPETVEKGLNYTMTSLKTRLSNIMLTAPRPTTASFIAYRTFNTGEPDQISIQVILYSEHLYNVRRKESEHIYHIDILEN